MIVAYIRVSSKTQDYGSQRHAIEVKAAQDGVTIAEWYEEKVSGKTVNRPELGRLRADAAAGKLTAVYVFRLDRLARSGIRDMMNVVNDLRDAKVRLLSCEDGFDLNGPCADIIIAVMAWAAQMELLAKNERIAAAKAKAASEGRALGRPMKDRTIEKMSKAREMAAAGRSIREIAMALGVPRSTVARLVKGAST